MENVAKASDFPLKREFDGVRSPHQETDITLIQLFRSDSLILKPCIS
jgi:hypothetical protein